MTSLGAVAPLARAPRAAARRVTAPRLVRHAALAGLALYGALHWATLVRPAARGDLILLTLVGLACGVVAARLLTPRGVAVRAGALLALALVTLGVILLVVGVPLGLLRPDRWDDLLTGIGNAIAALPALRMPYRGNDPWIRIILPAGGGVLLALGATLALLPRPRLFGATLALGVLYAVPVVQRGPDHPYLDGAVFAVLLGALLWAGHLRDRHAPIAVGLAFLALVAAVLVAPRVDGGTPWVDYEALAEQLQGGKSTAFAWNHSYAPLTWPRDGIELARVRSKGEVYLKTADLERFDGLTWRQNRDPRRLDRPDTEFSTSHPEWRQTIHVTIKGLKTTQFLGAGTTTYISKSSREMTEATPGTYEVTGKPLRRGDSYDALVYVPKPSSDELREAGTDYPRFVFRQLSVDLPAAPGEAQRRVFVTPWGAGTQTPWVDGGRFIPQADAAGPVLLASAYRPFYELAQQLRNGSTDPANYVQRVIARVQRGARYTETPPPPGRLSPLEAFLFRDHAGYCQHFAGATALLLRLGGVPARVVAGFSPGSTDEGDHVIRDLDAHSWVEAYFPHLGWVTFDPTPAAAPARSQLDDTGGQSSTDTSLEVTSQTPGDVAPVPTDASGLGSTATAASSGSSGTSVWWWAVPLGVIGVPIVVLALLALLHRRRVARSSDPDVEELRIALARTGRRPPPDLTLQQVEALLRDNEAATGYVRALRHARYRTGADPPEPPTPHQRRALRTQLREGLGVTGRLRSWWALPPHPKEVAEALRLRHRRPYIG